MSLHEKENPPIYLDTSALNYLVNSFEENDFLVKSRYWLVSPLNIYELLATSNENKRNDLFYKITNLIKEPIIMSNISRIMFDLVFYYNPELTDSEKDFNENWFSAIKNKNTILSRPSDSQSYERYDFLNSLAFQTLKDIYSNKSKNSKNEKESLITLIYFLENKYRFLDKSIKQRVLLFFIILIFCIGIDSVENSFHLFWKEKNIHKVLGSAEYIVKNNFDEILNSLDLDIMFQFIDFHSKTKKGIDRGLFFDSLHLIYLRTLLPIGYFMTSDKDIRDFFEADSKYSFLSSLVLYLDFNSKNDDLIIKNKVEL